MKIWTEPKVTIICRPLYAQPDHLRVEWIDGNNQNIHSGWGASLVEYAGRLCYMSQANPSGKTTTEYIENILKQGHGSVLEHASWTLLIEGVSRSLTHELVRHRAGTAYCLAGDAKVYSASRENGRYNGVKKTWTMRQLWEWSQDPKRKGRLKLIRVRCWNGSEFVPAPILSVAASGKKSICKVTLESGKTVRSSADHRFLTPEGWRAVRDLFPGSALATNGQPVYKSSQWLVQKYWTEETSQEEMGRQAGVSVHTIRAWIRRHGLQKPLGSWTVGVEPWNKGKTYVAGWTHTEETKQFLSAQKQGERNPQWRGAQAGPNAGRRRARLLFADGPCETCGRTGNSHRHHADRDPLNNDVRNVKILCSSCHRQRHLEEDGPVRMTVKWDRIKTIELDGEEETFDLEIDHPAHNFVVNGIVTHNSQLSQRYVEHVEVVMPPAISALEDLWVQQGWTERARESCLNYEDQLVQLKAAGIKGKALKEAARSLLPNCAETKIVMTANARTWRHIIELRSGEGADAEIRRLFRVVLAVLKAEASALFGDFSDDGVPKYSKV